VDDAVEHGALGAYSIEEFVELQESPRVLWSELPAGDVTEEAALEWSIKSDGVSPKDRPRGGRLRREPDMFLSGRMGR
jgi:hypothetical protein